MLAPLQCCSPLPNMLSLGLRSSNPDSCTERRARALQVLKAAKLAEVPRDVIDRNLKKASDKQQADFSEVRRRACAPQAWARLPRLVPEPAVRVVPCLCLLRTRVDAVLKQA